MKTGFRILIATVCTLTSGFGGIGGAMLLAASAFECHSNPTAIPALSCAFGGAIASVILVAYVFAWLAYFAMVVSWIEGSRMPRWVPVAGTAAALSFFIPEILDGGSLDGLFLGAIALQLVMVLPAFLLALFLVGYHLRRQR